jgi:hypothetical protein
VRLVNRGRATCNEHGWTRAAAVSTTSTSDAGHDRTDTDLTRGTAHGLPTVILAPGQSAYVVVTGSDVRFNAAGNAIPCPPPFRALLITLPGSGHALEIDPAFSPELSRFGGFPSCAGVQITPVLPASVVAASAFRTSANDPALPWCHAGQLHAKYRAGAFGTGNDFGAITIVNASAQSCQASGAIAVRPVDRSGALIRVAGHPRTTVHFNTVQFRSRGSTRDAVAILLGASIRTADGVGACAVKDQVVPAAWRLTGVVAATVPNTDAAVRPKQHGTARHLYGCASPSGIGLLNVSLSG